jgi:hypothetical protein
LSVRVQPGFLFVRLRDLRPLPANGMLLVPHPMAKTSFVSEEQLHRQEGRIRALSPLCGPYRKEKIFNVRLADLAATYSPAS